MATIKGIIRIEIGFQFRLASEQKTSTLKVPQGAAVQNSNSATIHTLHSSREDEKVEVVLESKDSADYVVLRYSTWTEGLGWCSQKTIRLDSGQLDDFHRALTVARHHINRQRATAGQFKERGQVIQLPTLA